MSNSVSESTIDDFCSITGCLRERAKFYLEAAGGNIDVSCLFILLVSYSSLLKLS